MKSKIINILRANVNYIQFAGIGKVLTYEEQLELLADKIVEGLEKE